MLINNSFYAQQITKPLLERKRRARINRCLDELKDLMYSALEVSDFIFNHIIVTIILTRNNNNNILLYNLNNLSGHFV